MQNIFHDVPRKLEQERYDLLLQSPNVRIERIVSTGQSSSKGFWYDQSEEEWVVVLSGSAILNFEEGDRRVEMNAGDYVLIPAHCRHRVESTSPDEPTIWLAVFYRDEIPQV